MSNCYIVSGYWAYPNGFGPGHLEMLHEIKSRMKDDDFIIVICSNENQYKRKYKDFSRKYWETYALIEPTLKEIFGADNFFTELSKDYDQTQRETLKYIISRYGGHKIFVNSGGEYNKECLPEMEVKNLEFLFLEQPKISNSGKEKR